MRQIEDSPKPVPYVSRELYLWGYWDAQGPTADSPLYAYSKDRNDGGV